ncbi:MAG: periplasmic heavy metal sensor [Chitinophagia bacterium]|nr:periplasmic heavy metal sensor [Chitinophagia bacterium]
MRSIIGRRVVYILFALLLVANIATLAILWRGRLRGPRGGTPPDMARNLLVREIGFDESQTARYDSLVDIHRRLADSLRRAIGRSKRENLEALKDTSLPEASLAQRAERTGMLVRQLELATILHFREVRAICRPGQRPRFDALMREVSLRMGPEGPPPPGPGPRR